MTEPDAYDGLPYLDVFSEDYARDPYPLIEEVRAEGPVARSDRGLEFLEHQTCRELLADRRFNTGMRRLLGAQGITEGPLFDLFVGSLLGAEGDFHRRLRSAIMPYFGAGAVSQLREAARTHVREWLTEAAEAGECDFAEIVGRPLPAALFCHMMGAPVTDTAYVADISERLLKVFTFQPGTGEIAEGAVRDAHAYLEVLIDERRRRPGDDLISAMVKATGDDTLTDAEIMDLAIIVLGGSTDNTNAQMCLNLLALVQHPDAWQALKQNPDLIPSAVLEGVRWKPGFLNGFRTPDSPIEVGGLQLPPDAMINTNVLASNRDPSVYAEPHRFDIERDASAGLNFGHGRHFCVGRPIALVVMEESLRVVLELWSQYEVGDCEIWGSPYSLRTERVPVRFHLDDRAMTTAG
jgi:cytochrome P450